MLPGSRHEDEISALPDQGLLLGHMAGKCAVSEHHIEQRLSMLHITRSGGLSVLRAWDYNLKFPLPHIAPAHWFLPAMNPHRPWAFSRLLFESFSTPFLSVGGEQTRNIHFDWDSPQGESSALGITWINPRLLMYASREITTFRKQERSKLVIKCLQTSFLSVRGVPRSMARATVSGKTYTCAKETGTFAEYITAPATTCSLNRSTWRLTM